MVTVSLSGLILLMVFSVILIVLFVITQGVNLSLKETIDKLETQKTMLKIDVADANAAADFWQRRFQYLYGRKLTPPSNKTNSKDLLDAVRKGMMAAHPDKGGKTEDFIRFRAVYEELKGDK